MSDDGEIDVESDEITESTDPNRNSGKVMGLDKRAHHNALERKRRDHIKDSFTNLRDCIPAMSGEKVSRAHILNKATEYIRQMQRCSATRTVEIEDLKKKNEILEEQIHALEQAKASGSIDNPEDLIASIAEKVQQRQNMRLQNQQNTKSSPKLQLEGTGSDGRTVTTDSIAIDSTPSSINVLANNIRTTQNLLNALAKNLPTSTANPQVRSLAARVLASPLRQPTGNSVLPRGVVTATAVPSSFQATGVVQQLPTVSQSSNVSSSSPVTATITATANQQPPPIVSAAPVLRPSNNPSPATTNTTNSISTTATALPTTQIDTNSALSLLVSSLPDNATAETLLSVASSLADEASKSTNSNSNSGLDVDSLMNTPQVLAGTIAAAPQQQQDNNSNSGNGGGSNTTAGTVTTGSATSSADGPPSAKRAKISE